MNLYPKYPKSHPYVWLWKTTSENAQKKLDECELSCVGNPEWMDHNLRDDFASIEEYAAVYKDHNVKRGTVARAWWDFGNVMEEGDIVILYDLQKDEIAAIGKLKGEYRYVPELPGRRSRRYVDWIVKDAVKSPYHFGVGGTWPAIIMDSKRLKALKPLIENL